MIYWINCYPFNVLEDCTMQLYYLGKDKYPNGIRYLRILNIK